jgi:polysaccharide chain length determinant protein (PEP-CTERM system associated)
MKITQYPLVLSYGRQLWRYKWLSIALAWGVCIVGWVGVNLIPPKYESSARVYISADQLLTPILNGVAVNDDPVRHVEYLQRTLLSRPNLEEVIHLSDLDLSSHKKVISSTEHEALLQTLAREIQINAQTGNLITISYSNENPEVARNVVSALLTIFSENSTGSNRSEMDNAKRFLDQQIQEYETQLRAAEQRRAEFHAKYMDLLPGLDGAVSRLDTGRAAVAKLQLDVADARSRRNSLEHELNGIPQYLSVDAAGPQVIVAGKPIGARAQLEDAQAKLADLKTRFTDQYPDVIALKRQIGELQAQVQREAANPAATDGSGNRKSQIANPLYDQVKVRLVEADTVVASAERALAQAQGAQANLEKKALETPGVLAQATDLDRGYEIKKKSYDELLQRREQTRIAEAADTTANKIQFRVVDAPQVPIIPSSPKQPLMLLGVFAVALGAALAPGLIFQQLDKSFGSISSLGELGLPVLGCVSRYAFAGARHRAYIQIAALVGSSMVLVAVFGVLMRLSINIYGLGVV